MHMYIITGGSRGLGAALVKLLTPSDAVLVSLSRTPPPGRCLHQPVDLSRLELLGDAVTALFKEIDVSQLSSVTLINNAGTLGPIGPVESLDPDAMRFNSQVNFTAPLLLTGLVLRALQDFTGEKRVVNISSGAAVTPYEGWSLYCAAKAGLEQFTRCLAKEQSRVSADTLIINFNPGVMDTDMQGLIRGTPDQRFPSRQRFVDLHHKKMLMDPERVAYCLLQGLEAGDLVSGKTYSLADFDCVGPA